jgi:ABC-type transport system involved in cytochrome c biogenesis ATPase subunit
MHLGPRLRGRRSEREVLDRLLERVRAGQSRVLVLRGESGVGKTALLNYLVEQASGCRLARAAGVQSEMELAYAGLHQLFFESTYEAAADLAGRDSAALVGAP